MDPGRIPVSAAIITYSLILFLIIGAFIYFVIIRGLKEK